MIVIVYWEVVGGYVLCCDLNGVLGSCDHGLLFMFDCDFLGCICFDACFVVKRVL